MRPDSLSLHISIGFGISSNRKPLSISRGVHYSRHVPNPLPTSAIERQVKLEADAPFATCHEWKSYKEVGPGFRSHLPVSMDGSCDGYQHLSALACDPYGVTRRTIYRQLLET